MPNIKDIAKACGVAPATISAVLNNRTGKVSAETTQRVLRVMRDMDYRPANLERGAARKPTSTLGIIGSVINPWDDAVVPRYHVLVMYHLLRAAHAQRQNALVFSEHDWFRDPHRNLRLYCDGRCDGLLVIASEVGGSLVQALQERAFPFVLIGVTGDDPRAVSVDVDDVGGARAVTEHLLARGHRRIGYVGGPYGFQSDVRRLRGCREALAQAGLPLDPAFILDPAGEAKNYSPEERVVHIERLLLLPPAHRPTALVCWNDDTALEVCALARRHGLRVPEDVAVTGFDDDARAAAADPPLTTVRQPYAQIVREAVASLLAQIRCVPMPNEPRLLPGEVIARASTLRHLH